MSSSHDLAASVLRLHVVGDAEVLTIFCSLHSEELRDLHWICDASESDSGRRRAQVPQGGNPPISCLGPHPRATIPHLPE
jgi:hypothetical protein